MGVFSITTPIPSFPLAEGRRFTYKAFTVHLHSSVAEVDFNDFPVVLHFFDAAFT